MTKRPVTMAPMPPVFVPGGLPSARALLGAADQRRARMLADALPPEAMAAAPVAPARGTMQLVPNWEATPGGIRRQAGAHWQAACALVAMNELARRRAEDRGIDAVLPFGAGQIAIAARYRALVEWRDGSPLRCASLEAGRGGSGGSGLFIDSYIDHGAALARLQEAIGPGFALRPRRSLDRGNQRMSLSLRRLVDMVVCDGMDLTRVLRKCQWEADGKNRKALRLALGVALDRMQGYEVE